jgi:glycosyltransferase involved in cell wall biosynthesis
MKILILEPYFTGSHAAWADGYRSHSRHDIEIQRLAGVYWKWRMHGGAVTLARRFMDSDSNPDLIVASDMLDLTTFQSLTRSRTASTPMAVYFHENQLSYPWSPTDRDVTNKRDKHYGFINYASAMAADAVFFNSEYHLNSFFDELGRLLKHFPDNNELGTIEPLKARSAILRLGMDLRRLDDFGGEATNDRQGCEGGGPLILWNHRWEYDKNPDQFFRALRKLADRGVPYRLAVLGESFSQVPVVFLKARDKLGDRVVQFGYAEDFETYARWLHSADILPVTSNQDFFGASVAEAVYCGCRPLLPERLAYPELIPDKHHPAVFYRDNDDFLDRLELMMRGPAAPADEELRVAMMRFDWQTMAPQYDRIFGDLAAAA